MEDYKFLKVEKHGSVSSEFIVKPEAAMSKIMEGTQALDIEDDVVPRVVKGDELAPEEKNAPKCAEPNTIFIEKVKDLSEPPCSSPVASFLHEAGNATVVIGPSLTVAAASSFNPMTTSAMETWPTSLCGVPLFWLSAMRALGVATRVGGQQQQ